MDVTPINVPQGLALVLNSAGDKSDVDFNYLVATAQRESSMNPTAKAPSSSAVGLFQFLDSTWLQVMKQEGPRLGYQQYADAITIDKDGDYVIRDKALRAEVLKLREDPQIAADMAAAFTRSNGEYLQSKFGRMPSPGELYIAHFLGPQGAEKMFNAGLQNPDQVAAKLFPRQAKANPQIFYDNGHPRTIKEVYRALVAKHNDAVVAAAPSAEVIAPAPLPTPAFAAQQLAAVATPTSDDDLIPSRLTRADMGFTQLFSTNANGAAPGPLIGTEAAAPLVASLPADTSLSATAGDPLVTTPAFAATPAAPVSAPLSAIDAAAPTDPVPAETRAATADIATQTLGFAPLKPPAPLTVESMQPKATAPVVVSGAPEIDGTAATAVAAVTEAAAPGPVDLGLGFATEATAAPLARAIAQVPAGPPRARILMTPPDDAPGASPFFTQLLASPGT